MNKSYIITFGVSALVFATVVIILLMLMVPQQVTVVEGNINKYDTIQKSEYTFENTKDISEESLIKQYGISADELANFKAKNQYRPGNSDPFTPPEVVISESGDTAGTATDKTTNSNGGTKNPASAGK